MSHARQFLRGLARGRSASALMVALCALGVALSTSIAGVVQSVWVNPLPYFEGDRLVVPWCVAESFGIDEYPFSWENYRDYREGLESFEDLAAWRQVSITLEGAGKPASVRGARVTPNFFDVLGVEPILGREFDDNRESVQAESTVIIGYGLWHRLFAGDDDVIGRSIRLDGAPHQIIGVLPAHNRYPRSDSEIFVPLVITDAPENVRAFHFLRLIGRLRANATVADADAEARTLAGHLAEAYPDANKNLSARVVSLKDEVIGTSRRALGALFSSIQVLFFIAWSNVAILLLVRGMARRGELELRRALGATRVRLFALLVVEACVLASLGCIVGLACGWLGVTLLQQLDPSLLPRAYEIRFTPSLALWAAAMSIGGAIVFGSLPAWAATRPVETKLMTLRTTGRNNGLSGRLVAVQIALAIPLLVASSMQLRSVRALSEVETGFDASSRTLVAGVSLPANQFGLPEQKRFIDRAVEQLRQVAGVADVAAMSHLPFSSRDAAIVTYRPDQAGEPALPNARYRVISHGLLRTLGVGLAAGREFEARDAGGNRPMVVLDETLADVLFPDRSAVGEVVRLGTFETAWEVIGVARAAQLVALDEDPSYTVYVPILQNRFPTALSTPRFVVRTEGGGDTLTGPIREALQSVDPNQAVLDIGPLEGQRDDWLESRRALAGLLWAIAAAALILAGSGVYATLAFAVGRRLREMAIRAALGAQGSRVVRTVLIDGLRPGFGGILFGLGLGLVLGRFLVGVLYGVPAIDVGSLALATVLMLGVMLLACVAPALRAARSSPTRLLREDDTG